MQLSDIFLVESPAMQSGLQQIAVILLANLARRSMQYLPKSLRQGRPIDIHDFPGTSLAFAFPDRASTRRLPTKLRSFIKARPTMCLFLGSMRSSLGEFDLLRGYITLFYSTDEVAEFMKQIDDGGLTYWAIASFLGQRQTTLVHELQHAYDSWASAGKFIDNPRSARSRSLRGTRDVGDKEREDAYLADPIEISARYTQTVAALSFHSHEAWKDFAARFKAAFRGWKLLTADEKKRVITRLATQWQAGQRLKPRDVSAEVKAFEAKLNAAYGIRIMLYYRPDYIAAEYLPTDPTLLHRVLRALIRFADIRRKTLAIADDLRYDKEARLLGFIRQRGQRYLYGLPLLTSMYRPARPALPAAKLSKAA